MNLAKAIGGDGPGVELLQASVVNILSAGGLVTIRFGGADAADDILGVRSLTSTKIVVGDTVWVLQTGGALLIVGKVSPPQTQFGSNVVTTDGGGGAGFTFPVAFPSGPLLMLTAGDAGAGDQYVHTVEWTNTTACWFTTVVANSGARATGALLRVNWIAMTS